MVAQRIIVAVEDSATASVVATAAAHLAMDEGVREVILAHVFDEHTIANTVFGLAPVSVPILESTEEGEQVLALAEAALQAEYAAQHRDLPQIRRTLRAGRAGQALADLATETGAAAIVLGARRPHAFGRLTHPDVRAYLAHHTTTPVRVVMLQADVTSPPPAGPSTHV